MDGDSVELFGERVANSAALVTIIDRDPYFDQFVRGEGTVDLGDDFGGGSSETNPHDGFQRMRAGFEAGAGL